MSQGKLVRVKISQLISVAGKKPVTRIFVTG